MQLRYEGRGATLRDAEGRVVRFEDREAALAVHSCLLELYELRKFADKHAVGGCGSA